MRFPRLQLNFASLAVLWLIAVLAFAGLEAQRNFREMTAEVDATGQTLHRLISQRAAQHPAHMTSLLALTTAADPVPVGAFRQVATSISQFYPRISKVLLVDLATGQPVVAVPGSAALPDLGPILASVAEQRQGEVRSYVEAATPDHYLLAKRVPDPAMAIVLEIDPRLLIEPDERPAWAHVQLSLQGVTLLNLQADTDTSGWLPRPQFSKTVDADGQPLLLTVSRQLSLGELVRPLPLLLFGAVALAALLALRFAAEQNQRTRAAQRLAQQAEQRALLRERETQLAHASRVNSMGELASGIAHELTQPLTALLSQSQAALRLAALGPDKAAQLNEALNANVREARRAGDMLQRMRAYVSKSPPTPAIASLNTIVSETAELLQADLRLRGITLDLQLSDAAPHALVDAVALQQVLHNLIRNAAEAFELTGVTPTISMATGSTGEHALITVADNGPGIPADIMPRLFEPFFSTKPSGMGLGLSLCQTLVEHMEGTLTAANRPGSGAVFTIALPLAEAKS